VTTPVGVGRAAAVALGRLARREAVLLVAMLAVVLGVWGFVEVAQEVVEGSARAVDDRLLRHELAHVRQWRREPVLFPVLYALEHLRHGYRNNRYEVEARSAEG